MHPFLDGNGRMGRLLITFYLCQQNVLRKPLLYLSHFFKLNKADYYDHLQRVRELGMWEAWLKFFLRGVHDVAHEATSTAHNIVTLRERHRALIAQEMPRGAGAATQLLEYLYERPITTIRLVADRLGQTYAGANNLVSRLVELDILREMTQRERNRRFAYADYLSIFTDDVLPTPSHVAHAANTTHSHSSSTGNPQ